MGVEGNLGARKLRQAEQATGETLAFAVAMGGGQVECVTPDDRHIMWSRKSGTVSARPDPTHFSSCRSLSKESTRHERPPRTQLR